MLAWQVLDRDTPNSIRLQPLSVWVYVELFMIVQSGKIDKKKEKKKNSIITRLLKIDNHRGVIICEISFNTFPNPLDYFKARRSRRRTSTTAGTSIIPPHRPETRAAARIRIASARGMTVATMGTSRRSRDIREKRELFLSPSLCGTPFVI